MEDTNTAPQGTTVNETAQKISEMFKKADAEAPEPTQEVEAEVTEETPPEPETEVQTFKVKVDGEEIDVPLDELLKGYSRTSDYTRKTQKVSEERKALEAEANAVRQERTQYAQALEVLKSQLSQEPQVDWNRLEQEDPIGYATAKLKDRDRKDQLQLVQQEQQRIAYLQAEEQKKALEHHVQMEQAKLADAIPEWKDAKVAKAEKEQLTNYLLTLGFSDAEISQIYDHRAVVALRKAAKYDEMMSKAKTQVEKAKDSPKTARPGTPQTAPKAVLVARDKFQQSGNLRDASAFIKQLMRT